jgi:hypothetical protein
MWVLEQVPSRLAVVAALACLGLGCGGVAVAPSWIALLAGVFVIGVGYGVVIARFGIGWAPPVLSAVAFGCFGAFTLAARVGGGGVRGPGAKHKADSRDGPA